MDFIFALLIFTISLVFSITKNISVIVPLLIGLFCFIACALYRGFDLKSIFGMIIKGMKKPILIIRIFVLIGLITAVWRASGTIAFFVYYGTKLINPDYFILFAFLLTCIVSFTLGTSFGTVGTIGVVLIVLARSGGVNEAITAGAIISGAYFGDRCSPTSSSANLVAAITDTNLYENVKNMFITAFVPFIFTVFIYIYFSVGNPLINANYLLLNDIAKNFNLNPIVMIPAVIIFTLIILKLDVKLAMLLSVISGIAICITVQNSSISNIANTMLFGYRPNTNDDFANIMSGGGLLSMVNVSFIILIASSYSGIFEETGMLKEIQRLLDKLSSKIKIYPTTVLTSFLTAAFCCNQSLAIILTRELMNEIYKKHNKSNSEMAIDIENTAVLISVIIPWNIAVAVPLATLSVGPDSILYAVFLFLVPISNLFIKPKIKLNNNLEKTNTPL